MRRSLRCAVVALTAAASLAVAGPAVAFYALVSAPAATTHAVAALTPVRTVTVTPAAAGAFDVAWTAPADPAGATGLRYTVTRGTTAVCTATTATTCRDTGLLPGSTHTWTVVPLLGAWTGPAASVTGTVPVLPPARITVTAPASATAGVPVTVTVDALRGTGPDLASADTTRTYAVSGPGSTATHAPTASVGVTFAQQPDGSVRGTAQLTLVKAETTAVTLTDTTDPARTATSGSVVVRPGSGTTAFVDCAVRGTPVACGNTAQQLNRNEFTAVLERSTLDGFGNLLPQPLEATAVAVTLEPAGGTVTASVAFAAGETRSQPVRYTGPSGSNALVTIRATPAAGWTAATVQVRN